MSGIALHNTIVEPAPRHGLQRLLTACLLLAALWAVAAPAFAQRTFARRFPATSSQTVTVHGDIALIGNTSLTCSGGCTAQNGNGRNNDFTMAAVDVDSDGATTNSSRATLSLPAGSTVLFAGLYWAGQNATASTRTSVRFMTPGSGSYATITATTTDNIGSAYQSFADVTSAVAAAGNGAYTVANVAQTAASGQWSGWTLVVAYQNAAGTLRNLSVFDGFQLADGTNSTIDVSVGGFITPPSGPVNSNIGLVTYDGDRGQNDAGSSTPSLQFGTNAGTLSSVFNAVNPVSDVFNSTISLNGANVTAGRTPNYTNTLGVDIDVFQPNTPLPNGSTSLLARIRGSSGDVNYPGIMTIATDVFEPEVVTNFTKSVTDVNGAPFRPGDEVIYTVAVANTGNDDAEALVILDPLPANVTYVPNSLVIISGPNNGAKTDAVGDDQVEISGGQIRFRAGTGANGTTGGVLTPSPTPTATSATQLQFRVRINDDVANNTQITNVASVDYVSGTTDIPGTGTTPPASFNVVTEADLQIAKTNTPGVNPNDQSADTVASGTATIYSLRIVNAGPTSVSNAVVTDTPVSGITCPGALGNTVVTCNATSSPAGATTCPASGALTTANLFGSGIVIPRIAVSPTPSAPNNFVTLTFTCTVN